MQRASGATPRPVLAYPALFALFSVAALGVYRPALSGAFVSDDFGTILANPYVQALSLANLGAILDPWGEPARFTANWAPVHLLGLALEWRLWGDRVLGYHVVNVVLHAGVSTLLVAWLASRGFRFGLCALAGAVFLLHPANVEAVAWIFQLKTIVALGLCLGALLLHPRRPALALPLFALALLTKASALVALPVAAVLALCERDPDSGWRRNARWLLAWTLVFALYAQPQFFSFERLGRTLDPLAPDAAATLRTIVAIGARYLVMAASGHGVSAFHSPPVAASWLDPWWLLGLLLGGALGLRWVIALARRQEEAAHWTWAAAAWAPVSQIFPFLYPMADRYLYFVLPGLIGGGLWLLRVRAPAWATGDGPLVPGGAARAGFAAALVLCLVFAGWSHARARVWVDEESLNRDTARHYPEGLTAQVLRAREAAGRGDAEATARALRRAGELGFDNFLHLVGDPAWLPVRDAPTFRAARDEIVHVWLRESLSMQAPGQADLRKRGTAYRVLGDLPRAEAALTAALEEGGPFDAQVRQELARVRLERRGQERRRRRAAPPGGGPS